MKKFFLGVSSFAFLSVATEGCASENRWYVGAGANWIATNQTNKFSFKTDNDSTGPTINDLKMEDRSAIGGTVLAGYAFKKNVFTELGYSFDSTRANASRRIYHVDGDSTGIKVSLNRRHTWSLGVGIGKDISDTMGAYVKISALLSQFEMNVYASDIAATGDGGQNRKQGWKLGWAPTIGLSKKLGKDFVLRADYSYQMYANYKNSFEVLERTVSTGTNKVDPRYHVVGITLTKTL